MKIPFSYKRTSSSLNALLITSLLGHVAVFGGGSLLGNLTPRFSVQEAPSSVEVIILKEKPRKEEKIPELRLLAARSPSPEVPPVAQKPEKETFQKKIEKDLISSEKKGALEEAQPTHFKNPPPIYPARAREEGWEGVVVLKVLVGSDGRPEQIQVFRSSGYKILDDAALKAVDQWQFLPARAGGISFSSWIKIPIRFILVDEK